MLMESLVRCAAWSALGVNGCFVSKAEVEDTSEALKLIALDDVDNSDANT